MRSRTYWNARGTELREMARRYCFTKRGATRAWMASTGSRRSLREAKSAIHDVGPGTGAIDPAPGVGVGHHGHQQHRADGARHAHLPPRHGLDLPGRADAGGDPVDRARPAAPRSHTAL